MAGKNAQRPSSLKSDFRSRNNVTQSTSDTIEVCALEDLAEGEARLVEADGRKIGVFRCANGDLVAIEDRCSHDDGPLAEGEFDATACTVECPRHGSLFDLRSGRPKTLPAYQPVETFDVTVEDGVVKLEI
jgi:3-phenylpropionate/trans-cinnamate dioxygenase ferredoxin subunit